MPSGESRSGFLFPRWTNSVRPLVGAALVITPAYIVALFYFGASPRTTDVGYEPRQPVPYSHALHAGDLGIDCRYCHSTVEVAARAAIPPTQTCMNCHSRIRAQSAKLIPVRESYATGMPIEWVRVHDLPDFVYFNHSAHVRRGVGCVSCHGRIDKMEVVYQAEPLSMGWCLSCHRDPEKRLRPQEYVTRMDWVPFEDQTALGKRLREANNINPSVDCSTCHR
ncbi:MAG: cytochrome c3 family protein [Acidobacteriota bacterium]